MRILVDVDGVCANTHVPWLARYNRDWSDNLTVDQITDWNIHKFVKLDCGTKIYDYLSDESLYKDAPEIMGALRGVQTLRSMGHEIVFLTSGFFMAKIVWLREHGFSLAKDWHFAEDIVICHNKQLVRGDFLIDDCVANLTEKFGYAPNILFDQPWNRRNRTLLRATNWDQIISTMTPWKSQDS